MARFYDPELGRFISADTYVADKNNPMDWDSYAYVNNNPIRYNDPSGHGHIVIDWIGNLLKDIFIPLNNGLDIFGTSACFTVYWALPIHYEQYDIGRGAIVGDNGQQVFEKVSLLLSAVLKSNPSSKDYGSITNYDEELVSIKTSSSRIFEPSPKHDPVFGWGSSMELNKNTAQSVLNIAIKSGNDYFGIRNGQVYQFKLTSSGVYHGYNITGISRVPTSVLKNWLINKNITKAQYNKMLKWSVKK